MSVAPGMSVAGGAASVVSGLGMVSIGGSGGLTMGTMMAQPSRYFVDNQMNAVSQGASIAASPAAMAAAAAYYHPVGISGGGSAPVTTGYPHQYVGPNHPSAGNADAAAYNYHF
mmetsp:Transcript_5220/g.9578  ORF Transcript_5220/g.9578 Transcript_5220/m.9578 type:complete len:114 (-) Transcript_5220:38-379(-)